MTNWIKVTDELPKIGKPVLALYKMKDQATHDYNRIYIAWRGEGSDINNPDWQYSWCCGCFVTDITHWAELPEPPND